MLYYNRYSLYYYFTTKMQNSDNQRLQLLWSLLYFQKDIWIYLHLYRNRAFPGGTSGKEPACQCRRHKRDRFNSWVREIPWRRECKPLQYSCLENPMGRGAWWATVHMVAKIYNGSMQANRNVFKYMWSYKIKGIAGKIIEYISSKAIVFLKNWIDFHTLTQTILKQ